MERRPIQNTTRFLRYRRLDGVSVMPIQLEESAGAGVPRIFHQPLQQDHRSRLS